MNKKIYEMIRNSFKSPVDRVDFIIKSTTGKDSISHKNILGLVESMQEIQEMHKLVDEILDLDYELHKHAVRLDKDIESLVKEPIYFQGKHIRELISITRPVEDEDNE